MASDNNVLLRTAQDVEDQAQNLSQEAFRLQEMVDSLLAQANRLRQYADDLRTHQSRLSHD